MVNLNKKMVSFITIILLYNIIITFITLKHIKLRNRNMVEIVAHIDTNKGRGQRLKRIFMYTHAFITTP